MDKYDNYFEARGVTKPDPKLCTLPNYLLEILYNKDKDICIMDIGCGYGRLLYGLRNLGFNSLFGIDVSQDAVEFCTSQGLNVEKTNVLNYEGKKYNFVIMSHVLEHIPKDKIITLLCSVRKKILLPEGELFIVVPNAQSNTDCYWAYEDFTHHILFTGGSLLYVLRQAGFQKIQLVDIDGLSGMDKNSFAYHKRKMLQELYITNKLFWNKVTGSSYHRQSPLVFTWEIKAIATA